MSGTLVGLYGIYTITCGINKDLTIHQECIFCNYNVCNLLSKKLVHLLLQVLAVIGIPLRLGVVGAEPAGLGRFL